MTALKKQVDVKDALRLMPVRPVYLVSVANEGKKSIISIGMYAMFSSKPCLVGVGVARSRFSFDLIRLSKEFVVNAVDERLMKAVNMCGENSGRDMDKFALCGLSAVKGVNVNAPLIGDSPVSLECRVVQEVEFGDHVWFIGEVVAAHAREGFDWKNGLLFKWIGEDGFFFKPDSDSVGQY